MIEADLDRYGSLARASCLADYLEILALLESPCAYSQLRDLVEDRWDLRTNILLDPFGDFGADDDFAAQAVLCLEERSRILGDHYPFDVGPSRLIWKKDRERFQSAYETLLGITAVHAYRVPCEIDVKQKFEQYVADSISGMGWKAANVAALSRQYGKFEEMMQHLGTEINIALNPDAAVRKKQANDAGVDVVAHLDLKDGRPGRWTVIGQVTCGSSDTWQRKISEAKAPQWALFMSEFLPPRVFLAVPHDIEEATLRSLIQDNKSAVLDRTRLTPLLGAMREDATVIWAAVADFGIQTLAV